MDLFVLKAIVRELKAKLIGARVKRVIQTNPHSIDVVLGEKNQPINRLVVSVDPIFPRIHLTKVEKLDAVEPYDFCRTLRKHLSGLRISQIFMAEWDRIVQITFEKSQPNNAFQPFALMVEIMGRTSNVVLVDARSGLVIDYLKSWTEKQRGKRLLIRNQPYALPPTQKKMPPDSIEEYQFCEMVEEELRERKQVSFVGRWIVKNFLGIGPQLADEIATRFCFENSEDFNAKKLWQIFSDMVNRVKIVGYEPVVLFDESGNAMGLSGFLPQRIRIKEFKRFASMNLAADFFYAQCIEKEKLRIKQYKLLNEISRFIKRTNKKLEAIDADILQSEMAEIENVKGRVLLENLEQIPEKSNSFQGQWEGNLIDVSLDPRYSVSDNSQKYFRKYRKLKRQEAFARRRKEEVAGESRFLEDLLYEVEVAETNEDLNSVDLALSGAGYRKNVKGNQEVAQGQRRKLATSEKSVSQYRHFHSPMGWEIFVGKSALGNDFLLRRLGKKGDYWFHAQGSPGSHVLLRMQGLMDSADSPPELAVRQAAILAAYFSRGRNNLKMNVDFLPVKKLRRPRGGQLGQVIFSGQKTTVVAPDEADQLMNLLDERV